MAEAWTVLRLINWTKDYFVKSQVESPRLCAEVLLASVLGCKRIELYARFEYVPTEAQLATFRDLVRRAGQHEPVAYLVGEKEFYSLNFKVTRDVLIPRAETEILVTEAVSHLRRLGRPATMWDVCTGSGCVAVAVAHEVAQAKVLATDLSPAAVKVAAENAQRLGTADRVTVAEADLLSLPSQWNGEKAFDVITANPPYVAQSDPVAPAVKFEPQMALYAGPDGLDLIRRIVTAAPSFLPAGGMLAMEFGYNQADAVRQLIVENGQFAEPRIITDHQGHERSAVAMRR